MKIIYKKKLYHLQWPKKWDDIVRKAAKKHKLPNGFISWKEAEANGNLKGLPKHLTYRDISQRFSLLKRCKTQKYKESRKAQYEKNIRENKFQKGLTFDKQKIALFREIVPTNTKKKHGWKPRSTWTEKQKNILIALTKLYRKSKKTVDWGTLVSDPKIKKLPYQDRFKLMKFYGQCLKREKTKEQIKHRRKDSIRYKYENYETYKAGQRKRYQIMKKSVNEFLIAQIPLR